MAGRRAFVKFAAARMGRTCAPPAIAVLGVGLGMGTARSTCSYGPREEKLESKSQDECNVEAMTRHHPLQPKGYDERNGDQSSGIGLRRPECGAIRPHYPVPERVARPHGGGEIGSPRYSSDPR